MARIRYADFFLGTELRQDGAIIHVWPEDKAFQCAEALQIDRLCVANY